MAASAQESERGATAQVSFDSTVNSLGAIVRVDPVAGYRINRYFAIDVGLPMYFVRSSATAAADVGASSGTGLGNAHASLRFSFDTSSITYRPSVTVTAPTGDESRGFSTGVVTWSWDNLLFHRTGRWTPYASVGLSNAVTDAPFFLRPFTSKGLVTQLEGGTLFALTERLNLGGSAYAIVPSGTQTVVSRVVPGPQSSNRMGGAARGRGRGNGPPAVWETTPETTGPASIARDHGASVWAGIAAGSNLHLYAGYSRSVTFALNTFFLGATVNVGSVLKNRIF